MIGVKRVLSALKGTRGGWQMPAASFTERGTGVTQQDNAARDREHIRLSVAKMEQKTL